ncbi:hypothetical protein GCM10023088_07520 [Actinomadura verrucosospora]
METIYRGTPLRTPPTREPDCLDLDTFMYGMPVALSARGAGLANGGGDLTRITVVPNNGRVVTAFPPKCYGADHEGSLVGSPNPA